jgi:hypothetical protein
MSPNGHIARNLKKSSKYAKTALENMFKKS